MSRIAVAGMQHETNTFSPIPTTLKEFQQPDNWPALTQGQNIFNVFEKVNIPISGFIKQAGCLGHECLPLFWCSAVPSGRVSQEAFEALSNRLVQGLSCLSDLDAVYLDLHGAMVSEQYLDADGELLSRVRQTVGTECFIIASLDLHANVSQKMFDYSDMLISYRTYPHVDMSLTGKRAAIALDHYLSQNKKPAKHFKSFDFLIPMTSQCTLSEPSKSIYNTINNICNNELVNASFNPGFPLADTPCTHPTVLVYGAESRQASDAFETLSRLILQSREKFTCEYFSPNEAIAYFSQHHSKNNKKPMIFADTQDNPGCGGSGNTTGILRELFNNNVANALLACLYAPQLADQAHSAGIHKCISITMDDGQAASTDLLTVKAEVLALAEGTCMGSGPFYQHCDIALGKAARLKINDLEIIVVSRNVQAADQAILHHLQTRAEYYDLLVLKSSVHFRADFEPIASDILIVVSPGLNTADISSLSYQNLPKDMQFV